MNTGSWRPDPASVAPEKGKDAPAKGGQPRVCVERVVRG